MQQLVSDPTLLDERMSQLSDNDQFIPTAPDQSSFNIPFNTIPRIANIISFAALFLMMYRTYSYVKRRRNGRVGHIMTPLLIKLWAVYAVIEFALYILALYLKPFGPTWLPSIIRATILPYIVWGRRLHHAANIYDTKLVPFFDTYSADIENLFSQAQQFWDELNEAFRELAQHLLNRIAVGGLSGAMSPINRDPAPETSQVRRPNGAQQTHEAPSALPHDTRTFSTARLLFAGQPSERADTIGNGSLEAMRGVILHTKPEAPKSAFEDSRALRRQFRNRRHASAAGKILEQ